MTANGLGPVLYATLTTGRSDHSIRAYCEHLGMCPHSSETVSVGQARCWNREAVTGCRATWLANPLGEPWLQVIEVPGADPVDPFQHRGWFSLEVSARDTDRLCRDLAGSPFEIIGAPANLDVSDAIRAMQLLGPSGEVLYLTEVKAEVPPFELPLPRCDVDRLFIPVMLTNDRAATLPVYEQLAGRDGLCFDTKITVINRARGLALETRHPVATLQLRGKTLIEIDQLDGLSSRPMHLGLPAGIAWIAFAVDDLPASAEPYTIEQGPWAGHRASLCRGAAGELYELIVLPLPHPDTKEIKS